MNAAEVLAKVLGEHDACQSRITPSTAVFDCGFVYQFAESDDFGHARRAHVAAAQVAALEAAGLLAAPSEPVEARGVGREALALALREVGFWGTHADRWNDTDWQGKFWTALADAVLASGWLADRIAQAEQRGREEALREVEERIGVWPDAVDRGLAIRIVRDMRGDGRPV